jgi:serine/threonine protein kinase
MRSGLLRQAPDISPNNILVGVDSETVSKVEQAEINSPSPRKILTDRTIHLSYAMPTSYDPPVITDFGAARLGDPGQKHRGDVMPGVFRAPEIIAVMEWDSKIDIWYFGVMVRVRAEIKAFDIC